MAPSEAALLDVLIVGGGTTALTTALGLAEYGVSCALLAEPTPDAAQGRPGEVGLHAASAAILDRLTGGAVSAAGQTWTVTRTHVGRGGLEADASPGRATAQPVPLVNLDPAHLARLLRAQLDADGRVRVVSDQRVVRIRQGETDRDGRVGVTSYDISGDPREWSPRFVVAADGPESAVRDLLGLPFDGPPRATAVLVADIQADLAIPDERLVVLDPPGGGWALEVLPMPDRRWRLSWIVPSSAELPSADPHSVLTEQLHELFGPHTAYELVASSILIARQRIAPRFTVGRVFLAGSAAHTLASPLASRSLNAGIQDADNLAWKLAYVVRGDGGPALLDSYEAERRGAAQSELDEIDAGLETLAPRDRWARLRRRALLAATSRRLDVSGLPEAPVYRDSSVIQPGCGGPAPDLPVHGLDGWSGPVRALYGGPMVVVAVGPTAEEAHELAAPVAAELPTSGLPPFRIVTGTAADATSAIDVAGAALGNFLVVRPDGHFAWKVNGEDEPAAVAARLADVLLAATGH